MKIGNILLNCKDTDEMPRYVAFHLGLHCLPTACQELSVYKGLKLEISEGLSVYFTMHILSDMDLIIQRNKCKDIVLHTL